MPSLPRRRLLQSLAAASVLPALPGCPPAPKESSPDPTPARPPEPAPWEPSGDEDPAAFAWGVQAGDATTAGITLSLRCTSTDLELVVVQAFDGGWVEIRREPYTRSGETLQLTLTGLIADTAYQYAFYDSATGLRSPPGRFRTAVDATAFRTLTFGATSCLGGNEPWPALSLAAAEGFDAFFLLGDTVYADGSVTLEDYRAFWRHAHATAGLRDLTASTSVVAAWDDHEVGNNWDPETISSAQYDDALAAFRESLPQGAGPSGGIWRLLSWGDLADIIVLDCRSERAPDQYISPAQMAWLKDTLRASTARFKLILNSVPINDYSDMFGVAFVEDRWQGYPAQRAEILQFIVDEAIQGVLWIAGDVHHAMICSVDLPGSGGPGEHQWEIACGPAGSTPNVAAELFQDTTGHYPVLFAAWNYTRFELDPGTGEARVTFIGDAGEELASMSLVV